MSKKYGFGVKLAAAALVVAGVVGTTWAQATQPPPTPLWNNSPVVSPTAFGGTATQQMRASYEIKKEAEIQVTSLNPTKDDFLLDATKSNYTDNGNLGWLRVKTNSPGWDVAFVTNFGGKLAASNKTLDSTQSGYDFATGKPTWDYFYTYDAPEFLTYATGGTTTDADGILAGNTDPDTVQLVVAVGMSEIVNNGVKALKGIKYGQQTTPYPTPKVPQAKLKASQMKERNGTDVTPNATAPGIGVAVSFAEVLTTTGTGVPASANATKITVGGVEVKQGGTITGGFGPTNIPNVATNPDADGWEYFYVNVGLPKITGKSIGKNVDGVYEETFTFTLLASF